MASRLAMLRSLRLATIASRAPVHPCTTTHAAFSSVIAQPSEKYDLPPVHVLRDHCRCPRCYNDTTCQRLTTVLDIPDNLAIQEVNETEFKTTKIKWSDGHESVYPEQLLYELTRRGSRESFPRTSWDSQFNPEKFSYENISKELCGEVDWGKMARLKNDNPQKSEFYAFLKSTAIHGLSVIRGVPSDAKIIRDFVSRIALIKPTFYGEFWNVIAEERPSQADTSYTNVEIGPHTDGTYLEHTPGIQAGFCPWLGLHTDSPYIVRAKRVFVDVFSSLKLARTGGENIFVDGEYCYRQLSDSDKKILSKLRIPHEFRDSDVKPTRRLRCDDPVLILDENGGLKKIRFNPYDRDTHPSHYASAQTEAFYAAYTNLCRIVADSTSQIRFVMPKNEIFFVDNWRVLHGRTQFEGGRRLCGCYLERDDFWARLKVFEER